MPEISLLQRKVLQGVVEKFTAPETLTMLSRISKTPWPYPTVEWEVVRGSRAVARPNVPNSEAHIVPRIGRSQEAASFIYLREKKTFQPTTLHWLRKVANNTGDLANRQNAEAAVLREMTDLNQRFDNYAEFSIWQAFTGNLVLDYPDVQANVDYKFLPSHKPTVTTGWAEATPTQIVADVRAWKRLISRDSRTTANEAYVTQKTLDYVFTSFATGGTGADAKVGAYLSDRMRDQYYATGTLPGFMGLSWNVQESVYDSTGAAYTSQPTDPGEESMFLADDAVLLGNFTQNDPFTLFEGPSADDDAGDGYTGKFSKTWKDADPSARQILLEWNILPVIYRPEQFVYVADVNTSA